MSQHDAEEELHRTHRLIDGGVGQVPFGDPVQEPGSHLRGIEPVRAAVVVLRQLRYH